MRDNKIHRSDDSFEIPESFDAAGRLFRSFNPQNKERRTSFLLQCIHSGKLKKWSEDILSTDNAHNRTQLSLVEKGKTPQWQHTLHEVCLDTNGLSIRFGPNKTGIFGHIPFSQVDISTLETLKEQRVISDAEWYEIQERIGLPNRNYLLDIALQSESNHEADSNSGAQADWSYEKILDYTAGKALTNISSVWGWKRHVPRAVIERALIEKNLPNLTSANHTARIAALFEIAERISTGSIARDNRTIENAPFSRMSHEVGISKAIYTDRSSQIRDPRMYEAIKIISAVLAIPQGERESKGIHLVRGNFGKNKNGDATECIGMYSPFGFHRVFIDPDKHLGYGKGRTPAREAYDAIPTVEHKDFATIEAAMLPFNAFMRAADLSTFDSHAIPIVTKDDHGRIDPDARVRALRTVRKLRSMIVTEVPEETYKTLTVAVHKAVQQIRKGTFTVEKRNELKNTLASIAHEYGTHLTSKDPNTLLTEILAAPERIENITYDHTFLTNMPQHIRDYVSHEKRISSETPASGARTTIVSALHGDIGFAREAQAWRALRLERRPIALYTSGASFSPNDPEALANERAFAKQCVACAFTYRANVFVPGTATHSTKILVEEYNKKLAEVCGKPLSEISLEDRQPHAQFVFFEPGGSLIFPGNPHMPHVEDMRGAHIAVDLNGATTGHKAGWSGNGDNSVAYNRHIHARQVNILSLADGLPVPVLARNGGRWSAVEHQFAAYDNFHILAMKNSGRHSALLGYIAESMIENKPALQTLAESETLEEFTNAVQTFVDAHPTLLQDTDLREDIFGSRSKAYLPELFELVQSIEPGNVRAVDNNTYVGTIEEYFKAQAAQIASEQR